ncbi:MAG TPA: GNAT family N-acetyltransferase [Burkholderiales bacterium]|nr:GNAT family N-acetyltransferase [Burkholderiales bacterium]
MRSINDSDSDFLLALYAGARWDELAQTPWTEAEKRRFLRDQFALQQQHYQAHYPGAIRNIIHRKQRDIGRIDWIMLDTELLLIDIALLPAYRKQGVGSSLLRDLQQRAGQSGKPVTLSVTHFNPAIALYQRLGFRKVTESGLHWRMQWTSSSQAQQVLEPIIS